MIRMMFGFSCWAMAVVTTPRPRNRNRSARIDSSEQETRRGSILAQGLQRDSPLRLFGRDPRRALHMSRDPSTIQPIQKLGRPVGEEPQLIRALGRWTLTALVVNAIIGGGIFGLPGDVAKLI